MKIFIFRTIARGIVTWIRITFIFLNIGFIIRFSGDIFWHSFHDYIFLRGKGNICTNWCFGGLFFRRYFNKCGLNGWFLWNAMVTMAQRVLTSLTFGVQSIALSIEWAIFPKVSQLTLIEIRFQLIVQKWLLLKMPFLYDHFHGLSMRFDVSKVLHDWISSGYYRVWD